MATNFAVWPTALAVLALAFVATLGCAAKGSSAPANNGSQSTGTRLESIDLGTYTIERQTSTTNYKDRLRFRESHWKLILRNSLMPQADPLVTFKMSILYELVNCAQLNLARPEMRAQIECKPLDWYVLSNVIELIPGKQAGGNGALYATRVSFRLKGQRTFMGLVKSTTKQEMHTYMLREDVVEGAIGETLATHDILKGDHFANPLDSVQLGYYFEYSLPGLIDSVQCSGLAFIAENDTNLPEELFENPDDSLSFAKMFALISNGQLLSLKDASCSPLGGLLPVALDINFSVVYQQTFPYLTLRHKMSSRPIMDLFNYQAEIKQTRAPQTDNVGAGGHIDSPTAYNTSVQINSSSVLFEALNMRLDQLFVTLDDQTGWEEMILVHEKFAALVRGAWSWKTLVKSLKLFAIKDMNLQSDMKPVVTLDYSNQPDEDDEYKTLTFKLSRDILARFAGGDETPSSEPRVEL